MAMEFKLLFVLWLVVACLGATTTTVAQETNGTTAVAPETNVTTSANTTTVEPTEATTTKLPGSCDGSPCKDGSSCEALSSGKYVCLCFAGDSYDYDRTTCVSAKVFPGELNLPNLDYDPKMAVKTSPEFLNASIQIHDELLVVFAESNFSQSTLLKLSRLSSNDSTVVSRSVGGVRATVEIIFTAYAVIKTAEVKGKLTAASTCTDCLLAKASFADTDLCNKNPCDKNTTKCQSGDGSFDCPCLPHFIETGFSSRLCTACPHGQQAEDSKTCVHCSFGYSGFGCKESWLLKLVIVSSVLGGLLLITLILLPILASKSSKKSSKKDKTADTGKPSVSHPPAKQPFVNGNLAQSQAAPFNGPANGLSAFANAGVPRIPRATTTNSWDNRTNLEMIPSNSRQNLIPVGRNSRFYNDQDDMNPNAHVRPQSSLYAQPRPLNNPYAQSPPQTSPYAQSQGHSNPYYTHDNGRRFN